MSIHSIFWKFLCTILVGALVSGFHTADVESGTFHRFRRSPQLFSGGRNALTDLTQMKPITLNDLNEFRQRMAALANLTTLLEQAVAAEKTARSGLQTFVNSIKEQVMGVRQAVNPDPENFWMESKECGGVMVSQTGKISYKTLDFYNNRERCIWTVRANYRSKIKIAFSSGNLEEHHDYVAVTELIHRNEGYETEWVTKRIETGQTGIYEGPVIFISFVTDGSIQRTGFQLDYEGMGTNTNTRTIYQHFHFTEQTGHFDSANMSESLQKNNVQLDDGMTLKVTAVINPTFLNASKLHVSVPENRLDLRPDECTTTNLGILNDFVVKPHGTSNSCCAGTCEVSSFETSNRMMVGIFTSSDVSDGSQFEINWSTDTNITETVSKDTCGSLLVGDFGYIEYKLQKSYEDNERCLWVLKPKTIVADPTEVKLQLLQEVFERNYDYVSLSYVIFSGNGSSSIQTKYLYRLFYSDSATFGKTTGFLLTWEFTSTVGTAVSTEVGYTSGESGSEQLSCAKSPNEKLHFYAINPQFLDDSPLIINVDSDDSTSLSISISIFGSKRGGFSKLDRSAAGTYQSDDGIIVVVTDCRPDANNDLTVPITWRKGEKPPTDETSGSEVFAKSVDECGEILIGDAGRISYNLGKEYDLNERCTWVIRARSKSSITVQLMADGFESCCDGIQINTVNSAAGTISPEKTSISRENRFHTFEGGVLFVMFYSDHSVKGTGFTLEFQTKGDKIEDNSLTVKNLYYPLTKLPTTEEPFGPIIVEGTENTLSIAAFVLPQEEDTEVANNATATIHMENINTNECDQDSVTLSEMPLKSEYTPLKRYPNEASCPLGGLPPGLGTVSGIIMGDEKFIVRGVLLMVMKIKEGGANNKSLSVTFR